MDSATPPATARVPAADEEAPRVEGPKTLKLAPQKIAVPAAMNMAETSQGSGASAQRCLPQLAEAAEAAAAADLAATPEGSAANEVATKVKRPRAPRIRWDAVPDLASAFNEAVDGCGCFPAAGWLDEGVLPAKADHAMK